jgi:hypothetical protein
MVKTQRNLPLPGTIEVTLSLHEGDDGRFQNLQGNFQVAALVYCAVNIAHTPFRDVIHKTVGAEALLMIAAR